jgi:hypothetical protein
MIILKAAVRLMPTEPAFVLIKYTCRQSVFAVDMTMTTVTVITTITIMIMIIIRIRIIIMMMKMRA